MKDESERRAYDTYTYPSLVRTSSQNASPQAWRSAAASTPSSSEASTEATQIASIQKLKQERSVRWQTKKTTFDKTISELRRGIEQLEQEIKNLDSIRAAEVAAEAQKNSWRTWLLSPLYKKAEESEEEKARKDRGRQERRLEKDMKERRLTSKRLDLKNEQTRLKEAKDEIDAADKCDEEKIRMIHARKWAREAREIFEREAKLRRQQQAQQAERRAREDRERQERMERLRREQQEQEKKERAAAEKRAAEQRRYAEATRRQEQQLRENIFQSYASTSNCDHRDWWHKVQGRAECSRCYESWSYLLECPGCRIKACASCQAGIRRGRGARTSGFYR